ncbi:uncharacterized protein [Amphiura filiformis]|uniref:uncharacterized protein n=1 Tax=Amphiura filiformis TaxID=82378 RepID=UPI003B21B96C
MKVNFWSTNGPYRPIVDYTGSIAYNVSRSLADILAPLVGQTIHHDNNSGQLAEELTSYVIDDNDMFNSHDVVSSFTNTPIDEALNIIKCKLEEDKALKNRTLLIVDDIIELLKFVLTTTYFVFRGTMYRQKFGSAMGSPVSPIVSNLWSG